jgi:hypothetical protein
MSSEGELFCRNHIPEVLDDVDRITDVPVKYWTSTEQRLPGEVELEAVVNKREEQILVQLESTIKRDLTGGEYIGKKVTGYEIVDGAESQEVQQ